MNSGVESLIKEELTFAQAEHGFLFNSLHEAESVLREEIEEAHDDFEEMINSYRTVWMAIKCRDNDVEYAIGNVRKSAVSAINEMLQICAVCDKMLLTQKNQEKHTYDK